MPELPEVETVRRTLEPHVLGQAIRSVAVRRAGVVRGTSSAERETALGRTDTIAGTARRGKQLALLLGSGRVVLVHLGMSGQLFVIRPGARAPRADHIHVRWRLESGAVIAFRDPRRFGGVWALPTADALESRWASLGPDALGITAADLRTRLRASSRAIKACLLDQSVLAGVGNIYADEALFLARIHPLVPAAHLEPTEVTRIARTTRRVLAEGIKARGSTLRDFLDAELRPGSRQSSFRVYGRAGLPCPGCSTPLLAISVAQRTTTFCPTCQPPPKLRRRGAGISTPHPDRLRTRTQAES